MVSVVSPGSCCLLAEWLEGRNQHPTTQPYDVTVWWAPSLLLESAETPGLFLSAFK